MSGCDDMSGFWTGEYRYSGEPLIVRFSASIQENGGQLTGTILEPNTFMFNDSSEAEAVIEGERQDRNVRFNKVYTTPVDLSQPPLVYQGVVNADFTRVTGTWRFTDRGYPSGSFTMSRVTTGAEHAIVHEAEGLPTDSEPG